MSRPRATAAAVAVASGLSLWLSHPPAGWWPLSFLTVPLLLTALAVAGTGSAPSAGGRGGSAPRPRLAFALGALVGLSAFGPMLWWLVPPAGVLGWGLLVVVQAIWTGLAATVMAPVVHRPWIVLVAPVAWLGMDLWRGQVPLGGFGWGSISSAHVGDPWLRPLARVVGGHGITLAVVLLGVLGFEAARRLRRDAAAVRVDGAAAADLEGLRRARPALIGLVGVLLVVTLAGVGPPPTTGRRLDVLTVQGNDIVDWVRGGADEEDRAIAERMLEQTRLAVAEGGVPQLTVWPESSIDRDPFVPSGADLRPQVEAAAELVDGRLVAGVNLRGPRPATFENTAVLLNEDGERVDAYVKRRLVPFGEYVPARDVLGDLPPLRQIPRDGIPAERAHNLALEGVRIAAVICFETLFPDLVRTNVLAVADEPAQLLVASTNDASFGRSAEPAQHLAQSRLRAVETGRWVVHAALSGSSAFVDPRGGVHQATDLFTRTWIRRPVPLVAEPTPYLVTGDLVGWLGRIGGLAVVGWALGRAWWLRRRRPRPSPPEESAVETSEAELP